jgi:hypothetical protein
MKRFNNYIIEKLHINPNREYGNISLHEQGYGFTSVNSMYMDIHMADDFIFSDLNLQELGKLQTAINYTNNNRVVIYDKPFQALKRRKYCQAIGNIILSENSFDEAMIAIQSVLKKNATCEYEASKTDKYVTVRIKDSYKIPAIIIHFTKL